MTRTPAGRPPEHAPERAVFLDRDGVVNAVVMRAGRPGSPRSVAELRVEPHAAAAVRRLRDAGFRVFVVTNQPDVARGLLDPAAHAALLARVREAVAPDDIVACPHDDADACGCRKPAPGMILDLAERWAVDPSRSWMVGDGWKDMAAGRAAGCRTILVRADYNDGVAADATVRSIAEAADLILKGTDG